MWRHFLGILQRNIYMPSRTLRALVVGGNLGSVGLVDYLLSAFPKICVEVACISKEHPVNGRSDIAVHAYQSGALQNSVNVRDYDFMIPGSHDLYLRDLVYALGRDDLITSYETVNNKSKLRQILSTKSEISSHNIRHATSSSDLHELLTKSRANDTFLLKPTLESGGGKGILRILKSAITESEIKKIGDYLDNKKYILEEYVCGSDISLSIFFDPNNEAFSYYADREYLAEFRVIGSVSSKNFIIGLRAIANEVRTILIELDVNKGFFHMQLRIEESGEWRVIEITERFPGDVYWWPAEKLGLPYRMLFVDTWMCKFGFDSSVINENYQLKEHTNYGRCYSDHMNFFKMLSKKKMTIDQSWPSGSNKKKRYQVNGFFY